MTSRSVEDDVDYLRQLAEAGASAAPTGGKYFVVWSLAVAAGLLATYGAVTQGVPVSPPQLGYVWGELVLAGWVASFAFGWSDGARPESVQFASRLDAAVWTATGAALTVVWLGLTLSGVQSQAIMMPIGGAAFGVASIVSAMLYRVTWLYAIAVTWWIVAFASFFMLNEIRFLLFSAAAILLINGGTGIALMMLARRRAA